ncbi:adenosylcobinamide-GDP ribazoletransferase [Colwellia asteriadis]|uniref:Adenosylcobinamide-GDP ribazoletransferase n=1 Tax=Colwellia asteriadis TaxID=517723 RepID=A0ABP3WF90_9GAMM
MSIMKHLIGKDIVQSCKAQLNLFYLALSFFTRIPVPKSMEYSPSLLNQANRYFSLVGLFIGLILASCAYILADFFPVTVVIILVLAISLLLTGAFHEDGLADMADGIGGAFEVSKRLAIMKDSRLGTYGAVTLFIALLLKFYLLHALAQINLTLFLGALFLAAGLSRALAGSLISALPYVTETDNSKSKPLAQFQSNQERLLLLVIGITPLLFYPLALIWITLAVLFLFRWYFKLWLLKRLGGFTGDCLGAAQQLSELLIYLTFVGYFGHGSF